jgi:acetyl esterase/lipase
MKPTRFILFVIASLFPVVGSAASSDDYTVQQDIAYLGPDRAEKMDLYLPRAASGKPPVVLYIHGGGWAGGDKAWGLEKPNCIALAQAGYATASINYKLNPLKTDGSTRGANDAYPQNIYDCKTALRFLRKEAATYGLDPDRIAVAGGSAGGHLAMLVAYTPQVEELSRGAFYPDIPAHVSCVINLFGITDLRAKQSKRFVTDAMVASGEAKRILELVSPITHLTAASVPTLVIHGTQDPTVPFSQAEALVKRLSELAVPHRFIPVVKGEHAFPLTPHPRNQKTNLVPEVVQFLRQHL